MVRGYLADSVETPLGRGCVVQTDLKNKMCKVLLDVDNKYFPKGWEFKEIVSYLKTYNFKDLQ